MESDINTLEKKYWVTCSLEKENEKNNYEKKESVSNVTALIISEITRKFPELQNCSETKFIALQETISKIIKDRIIFN